MMHYRNYGRNGVARTTVRPRLEERNAVWQAFVGTSMFLMLAAVYFWDLIV